MRSKEELEKFDPLEVQESNSDFTKAAIKNLTEVVRDAESAVEKEKYAILPIETKISSKIELSSFEVERRNSATDPEENQFYILTKNDSEIVLSRDEAESMALCLKALLNYDWTKK